jgi:hypothetical protein
MNERQIVRTSNFYNIERQNVESRAILPNLT